MSSNTAMQLKVELQKKTGATFDHEASSTGRIVEILLPEQLRQILRDLRMQQIELEMQNVELRRAYAAAELSEKRYLDLYNTAPVAYITLGKNNQIQDANQAATNLLGLSRDELVKQAITRFIHAEDQHLFAQHREQLIKTLLPQTCELRMQKNSKALFWAHLDAVATLDVAGTLVHRVVLSDITESKKIQEERLQWERQRRQLQKSESLGRMAGAIAHHFNNQLQAVMMSLELATSSQGGGTDIHEHLIEAMRSSQKAAEVSSLMLTYLGQSHAKQRPLDFSEVCRHALSLLQAAMPHSVELKTDLPMPGPVVRANENQIQQALTNLLTNAWEAHADRAGRIRIAVRTVTAAEIPKSNLSPMDFNLQDTDYACLEVEDTGCGMPEQDVEKLFDPFFSTKFTGRGLGLPVVLGIVRSHQGAIAVESNLGQGTIFRIYLPISADDLVAKRDVPAEPIAAIKSGNGTLLVVDDEASVRHTLTLALNRMGYHVLTASDGEEAVRLFGEHREMIQCVFCDMTMPRMNGWETLEAIRKLKPGIPVILSSGYSKEQVMAGQLGEMPQAILTKPYRLKEIGDVVSQVMKTQD